MKSAMKVVDTAANIRVIGLICQGMFASRIFCMFGSRSGGLVSTDDFKGGLNLVAQIAESDFVMPFLFICMEQLGSHWKNFHEIRLFFENLLRKFKLH